MNENLWRLIPKHEESAYLDFKPSSKELVEVPLYFPMPPLMSRIEKLNNAEVRNVSDYIGYQTLIHFLPVFRKLMMEKNPWCEC